MDVLPRYCDSAGHQSRQGLAGLFSAAIRGPETRSAVVYHRMSE